MPAIDDATPSRYRIAADSDGSMIADMLTAFLTLAPAVSFTVTALLVTVVASILLVAGLVAPFLSVWYAIHRFDSYRPH